MDFTITQKSRDLYLENEIFYFLQIKKSLITHEGLLYDKNSFAAEVTFKVCKIYLKKPNLTILTRLKSQNFPCQPW